MVNPYLDSKPALSTVDPCRTRIRKEAEEIVAREPELATFIYSSVLHHDRLEAAVVHRIAERLDHSALSGDLIRQAYSEALRDDRDIGNAFRADLVAVYDRDPATSRFIDPLLYFKGFHAIQAHRLAHWLYKKGRRDFAFYIQSRSSAEFQVDINRRRGSERLFLDHATGFVVGEDRGNRGRRLDPARRHPRGTGQGERGPPPQDPPRRDDRRRRQDLGKHRDRPVRAHRRGLGGAEPVGETRHGRRRPARSWARRAAPSPRAPWTRCSTPSGCDVRVLHGSTETSRVSSPGLTRQSIFREDGCADLIRA